VNTTERSAKDVVDEFFRRQAAISIGVITPHGATGPEAEWALIAGEQIATRTARIPAPGGTPDDPGTPPTSPTGLRALSAPAALDAAVHSFAPQPIDAIGYASTTTGYAIGYRAELELLDRLERRWTVPAGSTSAAAVTALREMELERLALIHPPWFDDEMNALGRTYFEDKGFDVVACGSADLPNDPVRIEADDVVRWVSANAPDAAQAMFLGGNGFRVTAAIARLESELGRPVLASNQILLWSLLHKTGSDIEVAGYGSVFERRRSGGRGIRTHDDASAP
jgi:maleate isomerase